MCLYLFSLDKTHWRRRYLAMMLSKGWCIKFATSLKISFFYAFSKINRRTPCFVRERNPESLSGEKCYKKPTYFFTHDIQIHCPLQAWTLAYIYIYIIYYIYIIDRIHPSDHIVSIIYFLISIFTCSCPARKILQHYQYIQRRQGICLYIYVHDGYHTFMHIISPRIKNVCIVCEWYLAISIETYEYCYIEYPPLD